MVESTPVIVVIGAGILGLASAVHVQDRLGPNSSILLVSRDWPYDESIQYTSPWAGAHGRPIPAVTPAEIQHQALSRVTNRVLARQAAIEPACGVIFMDGYDFVAAPSDAYKQLKGGYGQSEGFTLLEKDNFPVDMDITFGARYKTWSLNSPVYCGYLLRKFLLRGGKTLKRTLMRAEEAFSLAPSVSIVINCSGFGFGDPNTFPSRGQMCLVSNPCDRTITQLNADGTMTAIIPRPLDGGTIIGATKEPNDWTSVPRPETRTRLLEMAAKMYPPVLGPEGKFNVLRDIVGRRPRRVGGLRLESEPMQNELKGKNIVHAYGAEGFGYAISWGVADEVLKMVQNILSIPVRSQSPPEPVARL